jgi:hypothetical protein
VFRLELVTPLPLVAAAQGLLVPEQQYREARLYFHRLPLLAVVKAVRILLQTPVAAVAAVAQGHLITPIVGGQEFLGKVLLVEASTHPTTTVRIRQVAGVAQARLEYHQLVYRSPAMAALVHRQALPEPQQTTQVVVVAVFTSRAALTGRAGLVAAVMEELAGHQQPPIPAAAVAVLGKVEQEEMVALVL